MTINETQLIEKWKPVLKMCSEIPESSWLEVAKQLETESAVCSVIHFSTKVLPDIRKEWANKVKPASSL